jgi:hypothetical protein
VLSADAPAPAVGPIELTRYHKGDVRIARCTTFDSFVIFFINDCLVLGASPGSAGCFKNATQTPNVGRRL